MRLLADENFPRPAIDELREAGFDVAWARTDYPGWKDPLLLELAKREGRILLTLDPVTSYRSRGRGLSR